MIPKFTDWRSWDAIKRVTYIAQITTALSFLASTAFAYAAWNEAHLARIEQKNFFISEKSPVLEAISLEIEYRDNSNDPTLGVRFKNVGGSTLKIQSIYFLNEKIIIPEIVYSSDTDSDSQKILESFKIEKDRQFVWFMTNLSTFSEGYLSRWPKDQGVIVKDPRIITPESRHNDRMRGEVIIGTLFFKYIGSFNDEYEGYSYIVAKIDKKK